VAAVRRVHKSYSTGDIRIPLDAAGLTSVGAAVMSNSETGSSNPATFVVLIVTYLTLNSSLNLLNKVR